MSRALDHCIDRFESPSENIAPASSQQTDTPAVAVFPPVVPIPLQDVISDIVFAGEDAAKSPHHILIVDDNAINRRLLIALMKRHKYTYREAVNGLDALNIYQETTSPRFDVVLMDLSMPVMDGMTASAKIRKFEREQRWSPTTIVALTGLVSASAKLEALESGMDYYLTKPVNFGRLVEVLVGGERGRGRGGEHSGAE